MPRYTLLLMITCSLSLVVNSQSNWQLVKEQDGINVFLKNAQSTGIKMLRVECDLPAKQEAALALLLDIPAAEKWIPQTKTWWYVRRPSETECYYYTELSMPWPVSNRDYVVHLKAWQQPATKVITVSADVVQGEVPEKEGIVRVKVSNVKWVLYPTQNGRTKMTYQLFTDPGGNIPAWVVNYFAKQAAFDIIKKMRELVQQAPYRNAGLPFNK
ncbi:MAG: START domain-containing protein [Bacteroidota bacterium]